jgi:hypothetical protein
VRNGRRVETEKRPTEGGRRRQAGKKRTKLKEYQENRVIDLASRQLKTPGKERNEA